LQGGRNSCISFTKHPAALTSGCSTSEFRSPLNVTPILGLPQDRGLGSITDDHVACLHKTLMDSESACRSAMPVSLQPAAAAVVSAANTGVASHAVASKASAACGDGEWIEVSKTKSKKKGKGGCPS
jgi:hypothetical protein